MNQNRTILIASIYLFFTTLFWAGNFIVGKTASLNEIPPISLNFYRWLIAWFILLPFTYKELIEKKEYIIKNIGIFIILGITAVSIFNSALFYSLKFTQVITGVLMISVVPVMIIFFSALLKIEKTNIFQIFGVALSLTGVVLIITKADIEILKKLDFNRGDLTMLIAMFSWSIYSALLKKKKYELSQITLLQVGIGFGVIILTFQGFAGGGQYPMMQILMLKNMDPKYYGRIMSIIMMFFGFMPLAVLPAGIASDILGIRTIIIILGVGLLISSSLTLFTQKWLRDMD